ncbi:MFS transporter [Egicoccus sp. AB-alg2]|uniref:MFS transporter n=1 Tax=Egicoccus sp. AB-alg2 TaxID=3242693 RepID=UPI00359D2004
MGVPRGDTRTRRLWLAYLVGAFGLAMTAQVAFLVPLRARELGAGFDLIGLIVSAGALAAALTSIPCGAIIDRLGPKRSFVVGAIATGLVSVAFAMTSSVWVFLLLQPLHGVARNLGWVASQTYITAAAVDADERPRLTGRFAFFGNVGKMTGPLLVGGAASLVGFRWALLVPAVYALLFATIGAGLRETQPGGASAAAKKRGTGLRAAAGLTRIPGIQVALVLTSARLWISTIFSTFLPVFLVEQAVDPAVAGVVMATAGFVAACMAPTAGGWAQRMTPQWATIAGLGCGAVGLLIAPASTAMPWVFLTPALIGVAIGLSLPLLISIVTTAAPDDCRGLALGLRGTVNQGASTAAPVVVGPLMSAVGLTLGFLAGGGIGLALLGIAALRHGRPARTPSGAETGEASDAAPLPPGQGRVTRTPGR